MVLKLCRETVSGTDRRDVEHIKKEIIAEGSSFGLILRYG